MRRATLAVLALLAPAALLAEVPAASWRVERADVRVTCPLTVGGSFEARTTALTGALSAAEAPPAALAGSLSVDLRTLDTGIGLRNEHMKEQYLEVGKGAGFDTAMLSDVRLAGALPSSFQGRTTFTGELLLHGVTKTVTGPAEVRREGSSIRVEASFPVVLAEYGIPKPQYLGVGVRDEVKVKVSLVAVPAAQAAPGGAR